MNNKVFTTSDGVDHDISTWNDGNGWYSCVSGTYRGLYSESDDFGPFASEQQAREAAEEYITEWRS